MNLVRASLLSRVLLPALAAAGCSSAYYSTMATFGVEKREILVDRVEGARDDQEAAKEQFKTTLQRFKEVTGFQGGDLEATYESLNSEYEECADRVDDVRDRVDSIEDVSEALFEEWESEIEQMGNPEYRTKSTEMLRDTKRRYAELHQALVAAQERMDPVLAAFRDQVLFLKHNLNAQAIQSLQGSVVKIEGDVSKLIIEMEASIAKADAFIASMKQGAS